MDSGLISYLEQNQGGAGWLVAVSSSQEASPIILRTGRPVIAMGGFTGGDPAMTVAKLQRYVEEGELRYVLLGERGGPRAATPASPPGSSGTAPSSTRASTAARRPASGCTGSADPQGDDMTAT
ncbi:hypothetical protein [Actinomadura sp. B10D3]|uniref:hypothetical protein n=1 Tax=Actinomadura sp. B10D3 TaxID=3153557 RepID=UPI00325C8ED5